MKNLLFLVLFFPSILNAQIITTIAGNGTASYNGDGGPAIAAELNHPNQICVDASGNIFIADQLNNVVRKINASGVITTVAGNGTAGYSGDGGVATNANLDHVCGVITDIFGNIYCSDYLNNVIRKINTSGIISTFAGNGIPGYSGDGGPATIAQLQGPVGLAIDPSGNIYVAEYLNNIVRMISTSGIISTIAGSGIGGYNGDGSPATSAQLYYPIAVCVDATGNIYISDSYYSIIRKVNTVGTISTIAGIGTTGYNGDGIPATTAQLYNPFGVTSDNFGNIYIADQNNNRFRKVNTSGMISTIAGTGVNGFSGDGGAATLAQMNIPSDICFDASGNIYIADQWNNRIRKITTCINISIQPQNDTVANGDTAKYWVGPYTASASYQWQENDGSGWVNLTNVLPYNGVNTDTLTIHNVINLFNNSNYRCIITNYGLCMDTSSSAILIIGPGLGIKQATIADAISIYPNPATSDIVISLPQQIKNGNIQLINEVGQLMLEKNINNGLNNIDISSMPVGVYIAKIQLENQIIYKKIIKN